MTSRTHALLKTWYPQRDSAEWVLGTIIETRRSSYRKAGAMMLFNSLGQRFGLLSGGCLESDLTRQARQSLTNGKPHTVEYELNEESDDAWQKGVGCGGFVKVLLQPVHRDNEYLGLDIILESLEKGREVIYQQRVDDFSCNTSHWRIGMLGGIESDNKPNLNTRTLQHGDEEWLLTPIMPLPRLLLFGGGQDAQPLAKLALTIGWQVTIVDPRNGYAREHDFADCTIEREDIACISTTKADAIVIMTHNLELDAQALKWASASNAGYTGLLGPSHRRQKVEQLAGIDGNALPGTFSGPTGLNIGAALPETIALSILAECHQTIEGRADLTIFNSQNGQEIQK